MASPPLQRATIHGHDVAYRMAGDGPAVLLIHGMAGSSNTWRGVMDRLSQTHTVIAPDLLGHGESDKPFGDYSLGAFAGGLRDLLGVLGIERVTVVGQSLGGGVAMQFTYQHPEMVERLVLVGSGGLGREVSWILRALTLPGVDYLMPAFFPSFVRDAGNRVRRFIERSGWRSPNTVEMWNAYASLTDPATRRAFVRTMRAVIDPGGQSVSGKDRLYLTAAVPTMIVWGDHDPIIPVSHGYAAHEAMPGTRLEIIEGAGHFVHVERAEEFGSLLADFLATTEPAAVDSAAFRRAVSAAG